MEYEANYWVSSPYRMFEDENLTSTEVRLLGIICGLTRQRGYCWASNEVLAKKIHKSSARTIQTALASLQKHGYIVVQNDQNMRRIYLSELCQGGAKNCVPPAENCAEGRKKLREGGAENCAILKEKKNNSKKRENAPDQKAYGEYENIYLTDEQFQGLLNRVENRGVLMDMIDEMSCAIQSGRQKPYSDYAAALRNWLRRAGKLKPEGKQGTVKWL